MFDLKQIRRALGLTQAEAATRIGTDHMTWSRWERGIQQPRVLVHRRRLEALRAEAERMLDGNTNV